MPRDPRPIALLYGRRRHRVERRRSWQAHAASLRWRNWSAPYRLEPSVGRRSDLKADVFECRSNHRRGRYTIYLQFRIGWIGGVRAVVQVNRRKLIDQHFFRARRRPTAEGCNTVQVRFRRTLFPQPVGDRAVGLSIHDPNRHAGRQVGQPLAEIRIDDDDYLVRSRFL
jgi:hypothetical protein